MAEGGVGESIVKSITGGSGMVDGEGVRSMGDCIDEPCRLVAGGDGCARLYDSSRVNCRVVSTGGVDSVRTGGEGTLGGLALLYVSSRLVIS